MLSAASLVLICACCRFACAVSRLAVALSSWDFAALPSVTQLGLPVVFGLRLLDRRLRARLRRLRLLELEIVALGLDGEEHGALLHHVAVLVVHALEEARYTGDQVGGVDGGGVAGRVEV